MEEAAREILTFTPQLFKKVDDKEPIRIYPEASSVLLRVDGVKFLLTAGHVLQNQDYTDIGVVVNDIFYILLGEVKFFNPAESKTNDKIDLTVWKLEDSVASDLEQKYNFLDLEQLDLNHSVAQEYRYILTGYPVTRSKIKKHIDKIKVDPFVYLTKEADKDLYKKMDFEEHSNIILMYDKEIKTFGTKERRHNPKPIGLSGSGLWFLPNFIVEKGQRVPFKLAGIMTEWKKQQNVVIATRIHIVTELIRKHYELQLPESKITKLRTSNCVGTQLDNCGR